MDTALELRKHFDNWKKLSDLEIDSLLEQSKLVKKLTTDYEDNRLFNVFRIMGLSEIPYIERLEYTQNIISYIQKNIATPEGFSYTGNDEYIVPCYNATLLEAFTRLGLANSEEVQNSLNWIKKYQVFSRNEETSWQGIGILKHGGCMNATPCYIGIGKTVRALITYAKYTNHTDKEVEMLIDKGTSYMLEHNMFQRLSNGKPISAHIKDIMLPQAYMLSLSDLVYIANEKELCSDEATRSLKELLSEKSVSDGTWKIDYIYSHKGYKAFDSKRKPSDWINYLFNKK